jgi:hypothetical protein
MDKRCSHYKVNSNVKIEAFIDKYISSDKHILPLALHEAQFH